MDATLKYKILSIIMDFFHKEGYLDLDDFAGQLATKYYRFIVENRKKYSLKDLREILDDIRTNFFIVNKIKKNNFVRKLALKLDKLNITFPMYTVAKNFISSFLEIGHDESKFRNERNKIISKFRSIKNPHDNLISAFKTLLQKITKSFNYLCMESKNILELT